MGLNTHENGIARQRSDPAVSARGAIVYEPSSCWTRMLRRALPATIPVNNGPRIKQWTVPPVDSMPVVVLVVEQGDEFSTLDYLRHRSMQDTAGTLVVAVVNVESASAAVLLAAGLTVVDRRLLTRCMPVARLIQQFCEQTEPPTLSLEQRIWKNLPWRDFSWDSS